MYKIMRKILQIIKYTGIWTYPLIFGCTLAVHRLVLNGVPFSQIESGLLFAVASVISLYTWTENRSKMKKGKNIDEIGLLDAFVYRPDRYEYEDGRKKAMYPSVTSSLIVKKKKPVGIVFGTLVDDSEAYVVKPAEAPGHVAIIGGSGTGKTQQLLCSIASIRDAANVLLIDPKFEITNKICKEDDGTIIFDPTDRKRGWGYDPFFALGDHASSQQIYICMKAISTALIPASASDPNAFFLLSAQDLLTGLLIYFYKKEKIKTLPSIARDILAEPINKIVEQVTQQSTKESSEYKICIRYVGMAAETSVSISANMALALTDFAVDEDLVYALEINPRRFNPTMLLESNIHICVDLINMERWSTLILLIVSQVINWGLQLPEGQKHKPVYIVWEEFTACMDSLNASLPSIIVTALRYLRSKQIYCIFVMQSISGMYAVAGGNRDKVNDILSNISYQYYLDATTPDTQKMLCDYCGTYQEKHMSWSGVTSNMTTQISFSESPIVRPQDLITLGGSDEAILISSASGYSRLKKTPAWKDKYFKLYLNEE